MTNPTQPTFQPAHRPARPTNTLAVLALVMAFLCAPAGIVLGVTARRQIARTGEDGAALATAGMCIGIAYCALFGLLLMAWLGMVLVYFALGAGLLW